MKPGANRQPLRARRARDLALATVAVIVCASALLALLHGARTRETGAGPAVAYDPAQLRHGAELFDGLGCARCHAFAGRGNPGGSLDAVAAHRSEAEIRAWIVAAPAVEPLLPPRAAAAKARYRSLSEEDLAALAAYLRQPPVSRPPPDAIRAPSS